MHGREIASNHTGGGELYSFIVSTRIHLVSATFLKEATSALSSFPLIPQRTSYAAARGIVGLYGRCSINAAKISEMVRTRTMSVMFSAQRPSG